MDFENVNETQRKAWNAFAAEEPFFAMIQSWEWGEFKKQLGWHPLRLAIKDDGQIVAGALVLFKQILPGLANIAYVPRGPIGDWRNKAAMSRLLAELVHVAREQGAIFLRIEPARLYSPATERFLWDQGFRPYPHTNQPRASIIIDLTPGLDEILGQMRKKTRYNIRYALKNGVTVRSGAQEDLAAFYALMKATGRRARFSPRILNYYQREWQIFSTPDRAKLFLAYYRDQLLAARMVFRFGNRAAEFHAASLDTRRKLQPNHLLVWEAIRWAKEHECTTYDLWGVPDQVGKAAYEGESLPSDERRDGLWGVYQFKRGFSKNAVYFLGTYDYVFSRPLYWLISNRIVGSRVLDTAATRLDLLRQRRESS